MHKRLNLLVVAVLGLVAIPAAAQERPKVEISAGYSYIRANQITPDGCCFNMHGGSGSVAFNVNEWFGLVADFGAYRSGNVKDTGLDLTVVSYLFGPRFSYRKHERLTPFAQLLLGGGHAGGTLFSGPSSSPGLGPNNAFAMTAGAGLDVKVHPHVAVRLFQAEYFLTRFLNGTNDRQNNLRLTAGVVFRLGGRRPQPPVNHPPVASCSADKATVYAESGESVTVRVQASDPDGDPLTYTWTATGGRVEGSGTEVRWNSTGVAPGTYTVTVHVDDGRGGTATCAVDIKVEARPNRPPTNSCSADRTTVFVGERVRITAVASDPDNDPLTYSWRTNGGQIIGEGAAVQLDTTGVAPGHYTVTGRVDDGRGGAADCTVDIDVQAPPPPPQASKINECFFRLAGSARVDNECKRILDDVALRLKNEPRSSVVIVGSADPKEPRPQKLAEQRGENAAKYMGERGIERSRITVRTAAGQKGAEKQNRRIDLIFVPEGATF